MVDQLTLLEQELREEQKAREMITHLAMILNMPAGRSEEDQTMELLSCLGVALGFERIFISTLRETSIARLHEWTAPGIPSFRATISGDYDQDYMRRLYRVFSTENRHLHLRADTESPSPELAEWFVKTGAREIHLFTIYNALNNITVIGFEQHEKRRDHSVLEIEVLKTIVDLFGVFYTRIQLDHELRESEQFLKMAQSAAGLSCWEIQLGHSKKVFGRCFATADYPQGIQNIPWARAFDDFVPPYDERLRAVVEETWKTGEPFVLEAMAWDDAHVERWVEVRAQGYSGEGEHKRLYGITQDIDSRKKTERKLRDLNAKLDDLARRDALTGLLNKREFEKDIHNLCAVFERIKRPLSLVMLDIDHFKTYNDTYGHLEGDNCLRHVGEAISGSLQRDADSAYRYGGEEFAVILPDTNTEGAARVAEKIRRRIQAMGIPHKSSSVAEVVTSSVGYATAEGIGGMKPLDLISRADKALYRSKNEGRNRISADPR